MKHSQLTHLFLATVIFTASVLVCGCGHAHLTKGTLVDPLQNQLLKLETNKANKGKRVSVIGFPNFTGDIKTGINDDPVLNVNSERDGKGRLLASFTIPFGKGANEVHVPETFTNHDIVLYDNDGLKHSYAEKLQFSFTLSIQDNRTRITQYPLNAAGLPIMDSAIKVYPTYLTDIRIDKIQ